MIGRPHPAPTLRAPGLARQITAPPSLSRHWRPALSRTTLGSGCSICTGRRVDWPSPAQLRARGWERKHNCTRTIILSLHAAQIEMIHIVMGLGDWYSRTNDFSTPARPFVAPRVISSNLESVLPSLGPHLVMAR